MKIGNYTLGENILDCTGLRELTPIEYNVLQRAYEGERIFKAPDEDIDGRMWALWLSALSNGKIYRIGAQFISEDEKSVDDALSSIRSHYENELGSHNEVTESGGLRWDRSFGNFILGKGGVQGLRCVNCIATSHFRPPLTAKPKNRERKQMHVKLSETITVSDNLFMVETTTRFLLIWTKPHSVVIPHILNGKPTMARGFLVEYTTSDPEVLEEWHKLLCYKVQRGLFELMLEHAHTGTLSLEEDEMHLAPYVKGFRCP